MTVIIKMIMITSNDSQIKTISEKQVNSISDFASNTIQYRDGDYKSIDLAQIKDKYVKTITDSMEYVRLDSSQDASIKRSLEPDFTLNNSI